MRTTTRPRQANIFYAFLRKTLGVYLIRSFRVKVNSDTSFSPPFIMLGNHVTSYDPFIMAAPIKHSFNYVTSDAFFRNPILRFLLHRIGCVPKTKFLSDMVTIKALINAKIDGGIIGIFPEGARSFDGCTLPLVYSTAKLIKLLKVDVIAAIIEGAMFTMPRWSRYRKKGPTFLSYKIIIKKEEISEMSVDKIYEKITDSLNYDEYKLQRERMNLYTGRKIAERLERFIYFCPSCKSFHTMISKGNIFKCVKCGYKVIYNKYGFFEGSNVIFDDTRKWNLFQQEETNKMISEDFLIKAKKVIMNIGSKEFRKLQRIKIGTVHLSNNVFYFQSLKSEKFIFDLCKISGINIQSNCKLEFYMYNVLYRLNFSKSNISAYSVKKILTGLKKSIGGENG